MTAVDDLAEVAREHGAWFHIDGAYGLIAAASQVLRPAFAAVADADSVIVDPHKWLATGVGCAATYARDAGPLLRAFAQGAVAGLLGPDPVAAPNGGYFSPSSPVIHMSVCPCSPSKSADAAGVAPEKRLGPYSP